MRDGRIVGGVSAWSVDPGPAARLARRNTIYPRATKMTVVKTVLTAIFEPFSLNWLFQNLDVGELPSKVTLVYGNAAL
jgi:hypothetical protein